MASTVIVDTDILIYKAAVLNEYEIQWDEETTSQVLDKDRAVRAIEGELHKLLKKTSTDKYLLVISHDLNFRYGVLPTYKYQRQDIKEPELREWLKQYCRDNHPWLTYPWCEGDDVMAMVATSDPEKYIMATIDKDLLQVPGIHYHWSKDELSVIEDDEADWWFYMQILMGDPCDGYKGIPGIGPVKAERILEGVPMSDAWPVVLAQYQAKGLTKSDALQQARVARILRHNEYDYANQVVRLWTP